MANRIMLNQTSYHGAGAIAEIVTEAKAHAFRKAFVCSDPDLIKFGVTGKVTDLLDKEGLAYEIYSDIKANPTIDNVKNGVAAFKASAQIISSPSAAVPPWIPLKPSASSLPTLNSKMYAAWKA